ncbi:MAG TPA: CTP synthase [Candidatus Saccharimonadales bacterium]|nr:CTP synthase [Candidatus Saccharimonadales bacterium]
MPVKQAQTKYIFVTGGVLSGVGKGITAASIGTILKARGFSVNIQKCDPYLNVDAGLLNPREHGEVFVTKDGAETDLDLGHYERFLDEELTQSSSLMSGRVLLKVIQDERAGKYQGEDVQIIPHLTAAIEKFIVDASKGFDIHIVEIGGTVGDIESLSFLEAIRELAVKLGPGNSLFIHVVYIPYLGTSKEFKTKPAQNSVMELRSLGIVPDMIIGRSEARPTKSVVPKLSLFTGVDEDAVILLPNARTIYEVPLTLESAHAAEVIAEHLNLSRLQKPDLKSWQRVIKSALAKYRKTVKIGVVAKYIDNQDTYICVFEALRAAAWDQQVNVEIVWIKAENLPTSKEEQALLKNLDGIVVPGGFGPRGIEGKIWAATYALDNKIPYLGLCLGLQVSLIAAARRAGLKKANSTEFDPDTPDPVVSTMAEQVGKENTGGTMRLGNYTCVLDRGSKARKIYGQAEIIERHRHRYEAKNSYRDQYQKWGIIASGISPDGSLVEMVEAIDHPYFLTTQAHPEFRSRPNRPHPLFSGLIKASQNR